ncbi:hypothetical protein EOI86_02300 [Hwanghaeella grinnelliae]|uniref:Uncharacterized protein n=1 Tax=Hwanghaeella grinnelliae TaxID=2500179 RepID=A0A437QUF8_9PROT|nr:hypothetical protein [Hwanghaeella grinnelliae]RVU38154.1 hypothetical protein EOI86_02300 [Hwanghaeella grinnelliae]
MTISVKPRAYLVSALLLAVPLVSCQSTSPRKPPTETQAVTTDPAPATPDSADAPEKTPKTVQQAAVEETEPPVAQSNTTQPVTRVNPESELIFLDFAGFDEDLSREMAADKSMIAVDVPAAFSLNDVPERLDRWFSKVKESGGDVQAREKLSEDERQTRGIVGVLLDIAVSAFKAHEAEEMLRPAQDYNVLVEYNKDTGKADRVLFYRR